MKVKITSAMIVLLAACWSLHAQSSYVHQVIVLNEGHYDYVNQVQTVPVTVGAYNPTAHSYSVFDTIWNARFASHVIVHGTDIFVAADNQLIRYDAGTYQRLQSTLVQGIRKLAVWNNQLLVSRGEYLQTFNSYFQVYNKNSLAFLYDLPVSAGPQFASEGVVVKDNIAYVAINNGFDYGNEVGLVGRVDLLNQQYMNEINLGVMGKNPENIMVDGNFIYTVNNTNYTTASVSSIDVSSQAVNTLNLMTATGCGASSFAPGFILFQVSGDNKVGRFNTATFGMQDTLQINRTIYGMATDPVNQLMYVGETDFTSSGKIFVYNFLGVAVDSFNVSVAPGNMAFDIRSIAGIAESGSTNHGLSCYPNPAANLTRVVADGSANFGTACFVLTDLSGRELKRITTSQSVFDLDVQSLDPGMYILHSLNNADSKVKIIKQ